MFIALLISTIAALATIIGGLLATHRRMKNRSYLAASLAFAAGAMIFVSFGEMLPHALGDHAAHGSSGGLRWLVYLSFFVGMLIVALIDHYMPASLNPSEIEGREQSLDAKSKAVNKRLLRSGVLVALILAMHNFPEGLSTFLVSYENITVGISLALAIAIHNIPEGIAIAAPIYAATNSRKKAITWAAIAGLAEVVGALLGALLVGWILPDGVIGVVLGAVAGMMVFVAIDEMLPAARRYQTSGHQVVYGLMLGMAFVAVGLVLTAV